MRRHESRRGAKVTCDADPEGVEPRKFRLVSADGFVPPVGNNRGCAMASGDGTPRGPRPHADGVRSCNHACDCKAQAEDRAKDMGSAKDIGSVLKIHANTDGVRSCNHGSDMGSVLALLHATMRELTSPSHSDRCPHAERPPGTGRRPWARGYNSLSLKKAAPVTGTVPGSD